MLRSNVLTKRLLRHPPSQQSLPTLRPLPRQHSQAQHHAKVRPQFTQRQMVSRLAGSFRYPFMPAKSRSFFSIPMIKSRIAPSHLKGSRRHYSDGFPPDSFIPTAVTYAMIGVCSAVYMYMYYANQAVIHYSNIHPLEYMKKNFVCSLDNWRAGRWWTLLTPSFNHLGLPHLLANMFGLYSLGPLFVSTFGVGGFLLTWMTCAVSCCGASLWWESNGRKLPWLHNRPYRSGVDQSGSSLGASGAVLGIVTSLTCVMPRLPIQMFPIPVTMPLWVANGTFALFSGYCMANEWIPWMGHAGHLGGMGAGVATYFVALRPWLRRMRL